jgi:hypothetical protein
VSVPFVAPATERSDIDARTMHPSRATLFSALVAALVVLPIAIAVIDQYPVGVVHDDGMYMILAKSLATGHGYRWINLPGEPHATHFPPGYPALLSLLWRIGPEFPANIVFFKMVNAVLLAVAAALVASFARLRLAMSAPAATLVAIAGCAGVPVLVLSNLVMSETLFLALLLASLLYAESCLDGTSTSAKEAVVLAIIGGLLMLVRSHGIAFIGAVGLVLLVRSRFRALAIFVLASAIVAFPWHHWQTLYAGSVPAAMRGDYESYGAWFLNGSPAHSIAFAARTVASTTHEIWALLFVMGTSGMPVRALRLFGTIIVLALIVVGLVSLRRRAPVTMLFICGFFAIILVWPFTPARFVWAVWPLLVMLFVVGAAAEKDWRPPAPWMHGFRIIAGAGALIGVIGYATYNVRGYKGHWWSSIARDESATAGPAIVWVARNTAPSDVIATNSEVMVYLYTGRLAVPATQFLPDDYFTPQSVESRAAALRSILQSYRVGAVAAVSNESLAAAGRAMSAGQDPTLVLRDSVPNGLIFTPRKISSSQAPAVDAERPRKEQ